MLVDSEATRSLSTWVLYLEFIRQNSAFSAEILLSGPFWTLEMVEHPKTKDRMSLHPGY